jgi:hypothetical protein
MANLVPAFIHLIVQEEMRKIILACFVFAVISASSQGTRGIFSKDSLAKKARTLKRGSKGANLTNEEVISGLREALSAGTDKASGFAGKLDGFYKNPRLFIPWPQEAEVMKEKLIKMGFSKKVEAFEMSLNRAAEEAARNASPVFVDAIKHMSVQDGFVILRGDDTAATSYLRRTSYQPLKDKFLPVVKDAIEKVKVTSYWHPLVTAYNLVPGVEKQDPNLEEYVTNRTINGLMLLIADEEARIRNNPAARVSDLLKKVFGK